MSAILSTPALTTHRGNETSLWAKLWAFVREVSDAEYFSQGAEAVAAMPKRVALRHCMPFVLLHAGCLLVFAVGVSPAAIIAVAVCYYVRMFTITGFLHRYFSHRTYQTSRLMQGVFALVCGMAMQRGALWWAAHHRHHHRYSDQPADIHSVKQSGFWWSHMGWITAKANLPTDYSQIKDLAKYPELVLLNRFLGLPIVLYSGLLYGVGEALRIWQPAWGTNGAQLFVWGFFVSTVLLFHGTCTINSLSHTWGTTRYETTDTSRNNFILAAFITLGEGWHNNHHKYPGTVRQGFFWWEVDATFYLLKAMSWLGLVWDLHPVPAGAYQQK